MKILLIEKDCCPHRIAQLLADAIERSRFTAQIEAANYSPKHKFAKGGIIEIKGVRKRQRSDYCGNHPGECVINPFVERPHKKHTFLEGSDWVEFNDIVNDLLDALTVAADVYSEPLETKGRLYIRLGRERAVHYNHVDFFGAYGLQGRAWAGGKGAHRHEDWCGRRAPWATFIDGTPGDYDRDRAHAAVAAVLATTAYATQKGDDYGMANRMA